MWFNQNGFIITVGFQPSPSKTPLLPPYSFLFDFSLSGLGKLQEVFKHVQWTLNHQLGSALYL